MASVVIKKAKIKKGDLLEVEYEEGSAEEQANVKKESRGRIHQDLRDAFKSLDTHLSVLCEQHDPSGFGYLETKISCTGYTLGGADESVGVTLIGQRELANSRVLNLVSPFIKWDDENAPYDYSYELRELINACNKEVHAYLFKGKHAPNPQTQIAFPPLPPKPSMN